MFQKSNFQSVNLRKTTGFLDAYVQLRNQHRKMLLSNEVTLSETQRWLESTDVEIHGIIQENELIGVILIYVEKQGEVTFFVKSPGQGWGQKLLALADQVALERKLPYLWAWTRTDNFSAVKSFEKNGYSRQEESPRVCGNEKLPGIKWIKSFESMVLKNS